MENSELSAKYARLNKFLKQDPNNSHLFQECFDLAIQLGKVNEAESLLTARDVQFSDDPLQIFCHSKLALANQDFYKAITLSESLIEKGIDNIGVQYNLNWALFNLCNFQQVVDNIKEIGNEKQSYPPFLILEARALHHLGRVDEAIFLTRHVLDAQPQLTEATGLLSMLLLDTQHYSEAKTLAKVALAANSANHESLVTLTTLSLNEQSAEKTKALLSTNPQITQQSGRLLLNLGQAQMLDMEFDKAEESLTNASELMDNHIGTWHALAWVKLVLNKIEEAGHCFQIAFELDRNFAESHGGLAVIAVHQGRIEAAEKLVKTALRLNPLCTSGRYAETLLMERAGDSVGAKSKLDGLIKGSKTPEGTPILDVVARVSSKFIQKDKASKD